MEAVKLQMPTIELPRSVDDIPKKKAAKYPKKISLNVDEETYLRWHELSTLGREPADIIRAPVKLLIDHSYELASEDAKKQKSHRQR